ncbi:TnsD family Tn7-like transposition protein [Alicyclobacillus sp. TC]|uniref:TnsD family Tn7-like transposition protein n=1 Tax=Alicyclobacillus sp. TC TaxID=2606450 RepID=UPI001EE40FB0|nr:TnsD family Tn7-like transposition protein [Alicyclobacillus sp. TC]
MMLPDGYPDEALYSIIARWQIRTGVFDLRSTSELLFGRESRRPVLGIQTGIADLVEKGSMSADEIIYRHTLYPYYKGFRKWLRMNDILNAPHALWTDLERELRLASCPLCIVSDFENFGEPYWHRIHLLPGVMVCPQHNVMLITHCPMCGQSIADSKRAYQLTPTYCPAGHSLLNEIRNLNESLLTFAKDSQLVLFSGWNGIGAADLQQVYADVLTERVIPEFEAYPYKTQLRVQRSRFNIGSFLKNEFYFEIRNELISQFGQEFLDSLPLRPFQEGIVRYRNQRYEHKKHHYDWLYRISFRPIDVYSAPIAHIVLLGFLFGSVQNFFEMTAAKLELTGAASEVAATMEIESNEGDDYY